MIKRMMFIAVLLLSLVIAPASQAQVVAGQPPLVAFGPRDLPIPPGNGFPLWYQDSNGLSLGQCNDALSGFCVFLADDFFNPGLPAVFPANWPAESFYYLAETFAGPLFYRVAIETGFAGVGNPADGQQAVFSRVRFRADVTSAGTYTITHPYGVVGINVPALGPGPDLNQTIDIVGLVALSFNGPTDATSTVGPFLRNAAGNVTDPATGNVYLANPTASVAVTGSPFGTNFVEIRDPAGIVIGRSDTFNLQGRVLGMTASPSKVTFPAQKAAIVSAATITITNPSTLAAATLGAGAITGANAADFTIGPETCTTGPIAANNGTCTVTVNFSEAAPGVNGTKSAVVSFPVTTPLNLPPVTVNLAGLIDNLPPAVVFTIPANNAINVPSNNAISVTFNEVVTGVSATTFTLSSAGSPVTGTVAFNAASNIATFTPAANLAVNNAYTATIVGGPTGIKDVAGNALAANFVLSFTTTLPDTTAPAVVSNTPTTSAVAVPTGQIITAVFNEPVNAATVNGSTFTLKTPAGAVTGAVTYDAQTTTARFTPAQPLAVGQAHTATITTGIQSLGGVPMAANFTWTFATTAAPTAPVLVSPANSQAGVGASVDFQWVKSTDGDNDAITYHLYYCANATFVGIETGCTTPVNVAQSSSLRGTLAGLGGYGAGMLLAGLAVAGGVRSRRKLFFFIAVLLISGMAVTACGTKSSDEPGVQPPITDLTQLMTKNVSGLAPAKQYYWKVVADDGKGALTESATRSFTTQ
jgi:hypothetical protein